MRKFIVGLAAILALVGAAYLGLFQREAIISLFNQGKLAAQGFTPAKTPSEAIDGFRKALKERNYEAAQLYLGGDYAEQFHKGAKTGQDLGVAIDNLLSAMETTGTKSDKVKLELLLLDPFPPHIQAPSVKQDGDKATAALTEEINTSLLVQGSFADWHVERRIFRSLLPYKSIPVSGTVDLRKEGEGDKAQWKIYLPVTADLRLSVDYLADKGSNYVNAINRVKEDLKNDATTKEGLERALKEKLEESK
jgi:hypothetical protein